MASSSVSKTVTLYLSQALTFASVVTSPLSLLPPFPYKDACDWIGLISRIHNYFPTSKSLITHAESLCHVFTGSGDQKDQNVDMFRAHYSVFYSSIPNTRHTHCLLRFIDCQQSQSFSSSPLSPPLPPTRI